MSSHLVQFERHCQAENASEEPSLATHMLVILIRGVYINLKFPFAQFTTTGIAAHKLYPIITEAVMRLEILGFNSLHPITPFGNSPRVHDKAYFWYSSRTIITCML